jgi:hypothetical protein
MLPFYTMFLLRQICQFVVTCLDGLLGKEIGVLLERSGRKGVLLPEIRLKVSVGVTEGVEEGLDEVTHGTGVTTGGGVAIINSSHAQQTLSGGGGHKSSTTGGRDETNTNGSALSSHLGGDGVGKGGLTSPVSTTDRGDVKLGSQDGTTDGGGNLGRALDSKANVSGRISDGNEGLEAGTLSGRRLLLDRHDLHDLVLKFVLKEIVNDLGLLNGDGEEEDLLDGSNLALLYETAKLGDGSPDVLVTVSASASAATSASPSAVSASAVSASPSKTSSSAFFTRHD